MARKLLAIMFTDIVGFTSMMGEDEMRTLEILRTNRSIHSEEITTSEGQFIKELGDGVLAVFDSAMNAVNCGIAISRRVKSEEYALRIGIHMADVTLHEGDVFGDGVNLASRIQTAAVPGSIFITETVHRALRSIQSINTRFVDNLKLKHVKDSVPVYSVVDDVLVQSHGSPETQCADRPRHGSIAVLPFKSLSADPTQQFIVDGMQDALIGELAQVGSLRVISRTSTMKYRDTVMSVPEIATELNVSHLVEATVFEAKNIAHIQVQLIKAHPKEDHVWASGYNKDMSDIYALYNEVVKDVTGNIHARLSDEDKARISTANKVDPEAYKAYLKGVLHWESLSKEGLTSSLLYFNRAIEIDKTFAPAYSGAAGAWVGRIQMGLCSNKVGIPKIYDNLEMALGLDSELPEVHFWDAIVKWVEWDWQACQKAFEKLMLLSPNHALGAAYYSHLLAVIGEFDRSAFYIENAVRNDPHNVLVLGIYAMQLNFSRKFEEGLDVIKTFPNNLGNHPVALSTLRTLYHNLGQLDLAFEAFRESYRIRNDVGLLEALETGYNNGGYQAALLSAADYLIKSIDRSFVRFWEVGTLYARAGDFVHALEYLEMAYRTRDANMPYLAVDPIFDAMRDEAGYKILVGKMRLTNALNYIDELRKERDLINISN